MKMKEKIKIRKVFVFCLIGVLMFTGCGTQSSSMKEEVKGAEAEPYGSGNHLAMDSAYQNFSEASAEEIGTMAETDAGTNGTTLSEAEAASQGERKLIRDVSLDIETKEFDTFIRDMEQDVADMEGYIEYSSVSGSSYNDSGSERNAWFTVRIPSDRLEAFVSKVGQNGNVTNLSRNVRDVTLEYVDIEGRIATLQAELDRLNTLLGEAASMEDILAIEGKISDVRYELESYQSQMNTYNNLIDYSTVNINIWEVLFVSANSGQSVWARIQSGFMNSIYNLGRGIGGFFIGLLIGIPYIILAVVVIVIVRKLVQRIRKKRKDKKDKEEK